MRHSGSGTSWLLWVLWLAVTEMTEMTVIPNSPALLGIPGTRVPGSSLHYIISAVKEYKQKSSLLIAPKVVNILLQFNGIIDIIELFWGTLRDIIFIYSV